MHRWELLARNFLALKKLLKLKIHFFCLLSKMRTHTGIYTMEWSENSEIGRISPVTVDWAKLVKLVATNSMAYPSKAVVLTSHVFLFGVRNNQREHAILFIVSVSHSQVYIVFCLWMCVVVFVSTRKPKCINCLSVCTIVSSRFGFNMKKTFTFLFRSDVVAVVMVVSSLLSLFLFLVSLKWLFVLSVRFYYSILHTYSIHCILY